MNSLINNHPKIIVHMHLIWEGIKRTYKLIKGQRKEKIEETCFRRTHSEGGSSSMIKKGRRA